MSESKFILNSEKLAKLQNQVRIGGKGCPRRKVKKASKSAGDDKKIESSMRKIGCQSLPAIEEVNFFMEDESVMHFKLPRGIFKCDFSSRCYKCKHIYYRGEWR